MYRKARHGAWLETQVAFVMSENFQSDMTEMLILQVVAPGANYGYDIIQQVIVGTGGTDSLKEGELYPVLHTLERQGMLDSYWVQLDPERRRKYYRITAAGGKHLEARRAQWTKFSVGVDGVLGVPQYTDCFGVG